MEVEREINSLSAETLALQNILAQVLYRISQVSPKLKDAVRRGFDDAASGVEDTAIRLGSASSPDHLTKAIRIVEELRTATLGEQDKPRHGV